MIPELSDFYQRIGFLRGEGLTEAAAFDRAEQEMEEAQTLPEEK